MIYHIQFYLLIIIFFSFQIIADEKWNPDSAGIYDSIAFEEEKSIFQVNIEPVFQKITIPTDEISVMDEDAILYEDISDWKTIHISDCDLIFRYKMHKGSGRHWTIGVCSKDNKSGIYFTTSTIGYRNIGTYIDGPIPWIKDLNNDGIDEIIIWDSFLAFHTHTNADYGLIAWVYKRTDKCEYLLDSELSCALWNRIISSLKNNNDNNSVLNRYQTKRTMDIVKMILDKQNTLCNYNENNHHKSNIKQN